MASVDHSGEDRARENRRRSECAFMWDMSLEDLAREVEDLEFKLNFANALTLRKLQGQPAMEKAIEKAFRHGC
jgi:hypothetical protein